MTLNEADIKANSNLENLKNCFQQLEIYNERFEIKPKKANLYGNKISFEKQFLVLLIKVRKKLENLI